MNQLFSFMVVYSGLRIYLWKTDEAELCSNSDPSYKNWGLRGRKASPFQGGEEVRFQT